MLVRYLCLFLMLAAVGCGKNADAARVPVCPSSGEVVLDGKPAGGSILVFHPQTDFKLPALPRAIAGADGKFNIGTYDAADGLPEGEYVVTVLWSHKPTNADETVEGKSLVHARFGKKETSPLRVTVARGADGSCALPTLKLAR